MKTFTNNFRTGVVTRVTRDNGHPAYDIRLNAGAIYTSVPIAMKGRSHFPVAVGDTVHLVFPEGKYDLPYIVNSDPSTIAESTANTTETSDYAPDQLDLVLRHINETLSLSESGTTIDATTARIQVSNKLRISLNNVSDNQIINASPFIDEVYMYIAELEANLRGVHALFALIIPTLITTPEQLTQMTTLLSTLTGGLSPSIVSKTRAQTTINDTITIP